MSYFLGDDVVGDDVALNGIGISIDLSRSKRRASIDESPRSPSKQFGPQVEMSENCISLSLHHHFVFTCKRK